MQRHYKWLALIGILAIVSGGFLILLKPTEGRIRATEIPITVARESTAQRGGKHLYRRTTYYLIAKPDLPKRAVSDQTIRVGVQLFLQRVTVKAGIDAPETPVPDTKDYDNDSLWENVRVSYQTDRMDKCEPSTKLSEERNVVWPISLEPGDRHVFFCLETLERNAKLVPDRIDNNIHVIKPGPDTQTIVGWCTTFLGSLATLPGLIDFVQKRRKRLKHGTSVRRKTSAT